MRPSDSTNAVADLLRRLTSLGFWGGVCGLFSFFVASGNLSLGAAILGLILLFVAVLAGPQLIASLWLMGAPTVFGIGNQFLKVLPFITLERLLFLILVGMIFLRAAFLKRKIPGFMPLEILMLLFLAYALISLVVTATEQSWRRDLWFFIQYAMPMTVFILSRRITWSERGVRALLASLTFTGAVLAAIGIMQAVFDISVFTPAYQTVTSGHTERAYGTFSNAHTYVATLVIFLVLTLMQFAMYQDALVRFVLIAAMLGMVVGIVLGGTRAPWGGAALALLIIFVRDRGIRPLLIVSGVVASVAGMVVVFLMFDRLALFIERVTDLYTLANRLALWATAVNMIAHNPVFGVGFGVDSFALHKNEYITGIGPIPAQYAVELGVPHNEYLHVAALLGIVGLCAFLAILCGLVRLMFSIHRESLGSPLRGRLALYVGAIVVGLMFNSLFSDTYIQDYFWMLAYFLAGFVAGMQREPALHENASAWRTRLESPT